MGAGFGVAASCCSCIGAETGVNVLVATDAKFGAGACAGFVAAAGVVAVIAVVVVDEVLAKAGETFRGTGANFVAVVGAVAAVVISASVDDRADTKLCEAEGGGVTCDSSVGLSVPVCSCPDKYAAIDRGCARFFG
jgi:hypothetical protein